MKSLLAVSLVVLGMTGATRAQAQDPSATVAPSGNIAAALANESAASPSISGSSKTFSKSSARQSTNWTLASLAPPEASLAVLSFSSPLADSAPSPNPAPSTTLAAPAAATTSPADPSPAPPNPIFDYTTREYRWEINLGVALVRFRSTPYYATAVGLHSSVAYYLTDSIAIEGAANTAFAPTIYVNEHVKYLGYGVGPRYSLWQRGRFEPWVHALVGGVHILPKTGLGGKNGFELQAGGGADYVINPRVSARIEADYVRTNLFSQSQNSAQGILGVVFHF